MVYSIEQIRDIVTPIARAHGIQSLYLFGSYARGEATDESDIDLRMDTASVLSLFEIGGIYADLMDGLNKELDLVSTRGAEPAFLDRIHKDEVLLYGT